MGQMMELHLPILHDSAHTVTVAIMVMYIQIQLVKKFGTASATI